MGKKNDERQMKYAAYMKAKGITRTMGRCPICNKMASVPMDNHIKSNHA
jgi:hypothetical protein